jgi:Mg-chelatase subunit ChlD
MSPAAVRLAQALDELYGSGHGEGSRAELDGAGGGRERAFPSVRDWTEEIVGLFGKEVYEEVVGRAAELGRRGVLLDADTDRLLPSVELLEQVLALKGALSEQHIERLRPLVARIVRALVDELAMRVRPALTGLATQRSTRRPGGPIDLRRTIRANLDRVRDVDGDLRLVPERLFFRVRGQKALDWRVILLVDVSGSMEESVIYSAMMAAILSTVPWVSVNFVAFSTEIVDLTERVDDPLALLLEISVGGGTHIARAVRYARELMTTPARTVVVAVTDFEEGFPVAGLLSEVRLLAESGATPLGLAALSDGGKPRYNRAIAEMVVAAGMPVAALTPLELARWVGERIRG